MPTTSARGQKDCLSATIVGAGMAGMSAALSLLNAGFEVTVIERTSNVGGKFDAINVGGAYHEHAYHFLSDWCVNFWRIVDCIGLSKPEHFARREAIKFLRPRLDDRRGPGRYEFAELKHAGSPLHFWENVQAGIIPPDDMIAYIYSLLDLVTEASDNDPDELEFLNRTSVNGFMRSRPYMTDLAALLHQEALLKAFAAASYETSVRSYRTFVRYFGRDNGGWVLKGDTETKFWRPFCCKLKSFTKPNGAPLFHLAPDTSLEEIEVEHAGDRLPRVSAVVVQGPDRQMRMRVEHLILAVPYLEVARLVERTPKLRALLPELLGLRKLRSRQMASLDLYFKEPLPGIPREHVTLIDDAGFPAAREPRRRRSITDRVAQGARLAALADRGDIGSRYGLSVVDNYQTWKEDRPPKETWLNVVSADFEELGSLDPRVAREAIIRELSRYLSFRRQDIDWERSYFRPNAEAPLFINSVGSWQYRPETRTDRSEYKDRWVHSQVENLFVAGDYCRSKIDLVCLEGAVVTGMAAAKAVAKKCDKEELVPAPVVAPEVSAQECERAKAALRPWLALTPKGRALTDL